MFYSSYSTLFNTTIVRDFANMIAEVLKVFNDREHDTKLTPPIIATLSGPFKNINDVPSISIQNRSHQVLKIYLYLSEHAEKVEGRTRFGLVTRSRP